MVKMLLDAGAIVDLQQRHGVTALMIAAGHGGAAGREESEAKDDVGSRVKLRMEHGIA